jgi:hypothetical protein
MDWIHLARDWDQGCAVAHPRDWLSCCWLCGPIGSRKVRAGIGHMVRSKTLFRHEYTWGSKSIAPPFLEVSGQLHDPAVMLPGNEPLLPIMDPRPGLDSEKKRNRVYRGSKPNSSAVQSVARHYTD